VTSSADAGPGSLREVIYFALPGETIYFADSIMFIKLTSGEIEIKQDIAIIGHSVEEKVTIDGNDNSRIFHCIAPGVNVKFENLFLTRGNTRGTGSGGIVRIFDNSSLEATDCDFH